MPSLKAKNEPEEGKILDSVYRKNLKTRLYLYGLAYRKRSSNTEEFGNAGFSFSCGRKHFEKGAFRKIASRHSCDLFTMKKGYARDVCDFSQDDTSTYFYVISFYFYFLLNVYRSDRHLPWITTSFVFVHPLHVIFLLEFSLNKN